MMSIGFRKSLLGFNTSDVLGYIENMHKVNNAKQTELSAQIDKLNNAVSVSNERLAEVTEEKEQLAKRLQEYDEKYEEITRLSENIGKLYLVAQANAQAIIKNSAESCELAAEEIERNLTSIAEAQVSLGNIKQELIDTTASFSNQVAELINSLNTTRGKITENVSDSKSHTADFQTAYEILSK